MLASTTKFDTLEQDQAASKEAVLKKNKFEILITHFNITYYLQATEQQVKEMSMPFDWHLPGIKPQPQVQDIPLPAPQTPAVTSPQFKQM